MMLNLFIPIAPRPQPRPRFTRYGHAYDPAEATAYKKTVAQFVASKMAHLGLKKAGKGVPIRFTAEFRFSIPKSWPAAKAAEAIAGRFHHTSRPDVDNLLKAVTDALNGLLWDDDSQIVALMGFKRYAETPGIQICVTTEDDHEKNRTTGGLPRNK